MAGVTEIAPGVSQIPVEKRFSLEAEMAARIREQIDTYSGRVSLVAAIGVLEVIKGDLIESVKD